MLWVRGSADAELVVHSVVPEIYFMPLLCEKQEFEIQAESTPVMLCMGLTYSKSREIENIHFHFLEALSFIYLAHLNHLLEL